MSKYTPQGPGPGSSSQRNDYFSQLLSNNSHQNKRGSASSSYCNSFSCHSSSNIKRPILNRPGQSNRAPNYSSSNYFNSNRNFNDYFNENENDNENSLCSNNLLNSNNQILIESVYIDCPFHQIRTEWYF